MPLPPNDIETLVENEAAFRTWVITSLSELQAGTKKGEDLEKRMKRLEKIVAYGAGAGSIILAIIKFAHF